MVRLDFKTVRDGVLLVAGLGVLLHEMALVGEPRTALLWLAGAMIGLPASLITERTWPFLGTRPPSPQQGSDSSPSSTETR
ncbi:hypothetical protein [Pseudonocardia sp. NPDC049635]|uniref:hypothetical protein n=1 Tax=Pseudonocardia sp. NPDC049635 TaxID=3155506 RepID=UPI0033E2FDDE